MIKQSQYFVAIKDMIRGSDLIKLNIVSQIWNTENNCCINKGNRKKDESMKGSQIFFFSLPLVTVAL